MDQLERMACSDIKKVHVLDCLGDFLNNGEQLWNTDTAGHWLIALCKGIWSKEAEKQQLKVRLLIYLLLFHWLCNIF